MRAIYFGFMLAVAGLAGTSAHAGTVNKTMASGAQLQLFGYYSVNPDCSSMGFATIRITNPPSHGVLTSRRGTTFPYFVASNPRSACNTRRVPSMNVEYRPQTGFLGTDNVTIEAIFPSGVDRNDTYVITVK